MRSVSVVLEGQTSAVVGFILAIRGRTLAGVSGLIVGQQQISVLVSRGENGWVGAEAVIVGQMLNAIGIDEVDEVDEVVGFHPFVQQKLPDRN